MGITEDLAGAMLRYTAREPGPNPYSTPIANVVILRADHEKPPVHAISRPAMCIVAQGAKWATFGESRFVYEAGEALVVGVEAPSVGRVAVASPDKPCLVLAFELDQAIMRSIAEDLDPSPRPSGEVGRGVFVTNFQGPLADCALRLVRLLETPKAISALYPGIMREICYWLLSGPHGGDVARLMLANGPSQRVLDAMRNLRERFAEAVRIDDLAAIARMSPSAFHRQFKALTSLTPLQFQKQLRLLEARRLMVSHAFNVERAAFEVGYESPSQFSREYTRFFGAPPKRYLKGFQTAHHAEPVLEDGEAIKRDAA